MSLTPWTATTSAANRRGALHFAVVEPKLRFDSIPGCSKNNIKSHI
jgi:hypothetical protein